MDRIFLISSSRTGSNLVYNSIWNWTGRNAPGSNVQTIKFKFLPPQATFDKLQPVLTILHTRSLLNTFASLAKHMYAGGGLDVDIGDEELDLWNKITKEGFNITNHLTYPKRLCVFELFVKSQAYRQALCTAIGGVYSEEYLKQVSARFGGSSFDGMDFNGSADQMLLEMRYDQIPLAWRDQFHNFLKRNKDALMTYRDNFNIEDIQAATLTQQLIDS